jgi:hypothetical protein
MIRIAGDSCSQNPGLILMDKQRISRHMRDILTHMRLIQDKESERYRQQEKKEG